MEQTVIGIILISVIFIIIGLVIRSNRKRKLERESLPDDEPIQDKIEPVDANGNKLYLSIADKKAWKTLSNPQRQQIILRQQKLIKQGVLVKVMEGEKVIGLVTRIEAIRTGLIK